MLTIWNHSRMFLQNTLTAYNYSTSLFYISSLLVLKSRTTAPTKTMTQQVCCCSSIAGKTYVRSYEFVKENYLPWKSWHSNGKRCQKLTEHFIMKPNTHWSKNFKMHQLKKQIKISNSIHNPNTLQFKRFSFVLIQRRIFCLTVRSESM